MERERKRERQKAKGERRKAKGEREREKTQMKRKRDVLQPSTTSPEGRSPHVHSHLPWSRLLQFHRACKGLHHWLEPARPAVESTSAQRGGGKVRQAGAVGQSVGMGMGMGTITMMSSGPTRRWFRRFHLSSEEEEGICRQARAQRPAICRT